MCIHGSGCDFVAWELKKLPKRAEKYTATLVIVWLKNL